MKRAPFVVVLIVLVAVSGALAAVIGRSSPEPTEALRISVGSDSSGGDPAILLPRSCGLHGNVVTATGTYDPSHGGLGDYAPEYYTRFGDVVELYVYSAPSPEHAQSNQIADLDSERPYPMSRPGPWTASARIEEGLGTPDLCVADVQPTHDFQGAPGG